MKTTGEMPTSVFLHGSALGSSDSPQLRSLGHRLLGQGWLLTAVMVFLTTAQPQSTTTDMPWLGMQKPQDHWWWSVTSEGWARSSKENLNEPDFQCDKSEYPMGTIHCYVYPDSDHLGNLASDLCGKNAPLTKDQRRVILAGLKTTVDVSEVYSPPRVIQRAKLHGLRPGCALDLSTGWDFSKRSHRKAALKLIKDTRPAVVILSPPCCVFSPLRNLTNFKRDAQEVQAEEVQGRQHLDFAVTLAKLQMRNGRGFLFEHPRNATSWRTGTLRSLSEHPSVFNIQLDMCAFGLQGDKGLHKKPTMLLTNIKELVSALEKRCNQQHKHQTIEGGALSRASAQYTDAFVDAILQGIKKHIHFEAMHVYDLPDSWSRPKGDLVCRHFRPRCTPPLPEESGLDLRQLRFTGKRVVTKHYLNGTTKVVEDDFVQSPSASDLDPWTGTTHFEVCQQVMLPSSLQSLAVWLTSSLAHDLFQYQQEQTAFTSEYMLVFPSHRILGSDVRDRRERTPSTTPSTSATAPKTSRTATTTHRLATVEEEDYNDPAYSPDEPMESEEEEPFGDEARVGQELRDIPIERQVDPPLAPELRRELYRVHRNLGHPDNQSFCRALRHAGVKPEYIKWVKRSFSCPICEGRRRPSSHRPAHLSKAMGFNEVIGVDLVYYDKKAFLKMVDWGTNYQLVTQVADRTAESALQALMGEWFRHYGAPRLLVCDQGREFVGANFCTAINEAGTVIHLTDSRSPWQNSRTERLGGSWKQRLGKICQETTVASEFEFDLAVYEACRMHNMYYDRSGFTPAQRVFGYNPRVPDALLNDDYIDKEFLANPTTDYMKTAARIREAAMKAWQSNQDFEAVSRAARSNTRLTDQKSLSVGETVYIWRSTTEFKGWIGPGIVVAESENQRSLWISVRGYLVKASREQVRRATSEESLGAELIKVLSNELLEGLETGRLKNYKDVEHEGGPLQNLDDLEDDQMLPIGEAAMGDRPTVRENEQEDEEMSAVVVEPEIQPDSFTAGHPDTLPRGADLSPAPEESTAESTRAPTTASPTPAASRRPSTIRVDEASGGSWPFGPARSSSETPRHMPYPFEHQPPSLPRPPSTSYFMEVLDSEDKVKWWRNKVHDRWEPIATSKETFHLHESTAFFSMNEKRFFLTKKKVSPGEVIFKNLPEKFKKIFRRSRDKEIESLLKSGAIVILSLKDSQEFAKKFPEYVLSSRYVDRWKPTGDFSVLPETWDPDDYIPDGTNVAEPKSRWCVVGWRDPHVHEIERAAPTPLTASLYMFFQLSATRRWPGFAKDAKTAFLQAKPTTRRQKLACRMPSDEVFPGYHPDQLILLLTEVYGLVSGPAWWRRSLLEILVKELGYRVNPFDRCVLTLDDKESKPSNSITAYGQTYQRTCGVTVIEVDDLLEAGTEVHRKNMKWLETKLRFGKVIELLNSKEGTGYAGRRIRQLPDFSYVYSMDDYVRDRLKYVKFERKILKKDAHSLKLTAGEEQQLRGALASLNWTAREGRPDASSAASIYAASFPGPTVADAIAVNTVIGQLKERQVSSRVQSIEESQIRHLLIADSSFDPTGKT